MSGSPAGGRAAAPSSVLAPQQEQRENRSADLPATPN
eukprot:CAMPEP_0195070236 /NCGR_PEP_ID=MMETSP0448-20130528/14360_1 /TAXON_ID=66468 /ORGANISM="Heterocapsa triquestra, Strain CCMP 448" /LENGTH=36 /DNA_ID= /DNA_START= /DNA_END= /DNA_ORIENTATION=